MAGQRGICPECDQEQPTDEHGRMRFHRIPGEGVGGPDCVGSGALMRNLVLTTPAEVDLTGLPPQQALALGALTAELIAAAEQRGRQQAARAIAYQIRAELVCCDTYDRDAGTSRAGKTHAICFWGEAGARIAETVGATGVGGEGTSGAEFSDAVTAVEQRGRQWAIDALRDVVLEIYGRDPMHDDTRPSADCLGCQWRDALVAALAALATQPTDTTET